MALYEGIKPEQGTRSNTHLTKSGHQSPACDWVLSKRFLDADLASVFPSGVLFQYVYGGPGQEDVVIPKGRLVGVGKPEKNMHDQEYKTTLTLPGLTANNNVVGMAPYNFCKDMLEQDKFGRLKPSIITDMLVDLPMMPGVAASTQTGAAGIVDEEQRISIGLKMPWGAVLGSIEPGDYVKTSPSGRVVKWDPATDKEYQRVGQVHYVDLNQNSWGWLQWMLWDESAMLEDDVFVNKSGTSLNTDGVYPFDPSYRDGYLATIQSYQSEFTANPTGIPGLHDGTGNYANFGRNDTDYTDIALGTVPAGVTDGTLMVVNAKDLAGNNAVNLTQGSVTIKINAVAVDPANVSVDHEKGLITIKLTALQAGKAITGSYKMKFYGTSSYLDFKGVVGQATILLQK